MTKISPNKNQVKTFQDWLLSWFSRHGRTDLPWQVNKTLYRVWISEIMLQQTQVSTAIPYYLKFMEKFPDLLSLANSHLDTALSYWAGLGYYARARNLHAAAIQILENHAGIFPSQLDLVIKLPGIGLSTASAILSIAENQPLAICDGNVKRVLSRLHCVDFPLNTPSAEKILWDLAEQYMPEKNCADYSQAIMDLGATLCTKSQPRCLDCPVNSICQAYLTKTQETYPIPKKPLARKTKYQSCLIFITSTHIALTQRPNTGIWGGLFTPIMANRLNNGSNPKDHPLFSQHAHHPYIYIDKQKHVFTHFDLYYDAYVFKLENPALIENTNWYSFEILETLALPAPIKTLLIKTKIYKKNLGVPQ